MFLWYSVIRVRNENNIEYENRKMELYESLFGIKNIPI